MLRKYCLLLLPLLLIACNPNNNQSQDPEIPPVTPPGDPDPEQDPDPIITTYTIDFTTFTTTDCADFDNNNPTNYQTKMMSLLNSDGEIVDNIVQSGTTQYRTGKIENNQTLRAVYVCGSGITSDGSLQINFKKEIKSFAIVAQAQYSVYKDTWTTPGEPYDVYSCDAYSNIYVNDEEIVLPSADIFEKTAPEIITKTYTLEADTVTISGVAGQRGAIRKLIFTTEEEA